MAQAKYERIKGQISTTALSSFPPQAVETLQVVHSVCLVQKPAKRPAQ